MRATSDFLGRALAVLERDAPTAATRLRREISGLLLAFEVDDEKFSVQGLAYEVRLERGGAASPDIRVRCGAKAVLQLLDGDVGVMDCVLAGGLDIHADVALMPALSRASVAFSEGAVRSRAMRGLVAEFRAKVAAAERLNGKAAL